MGVDQHKRDEFLGENPSELCKQCVDRGEVIKGKFSG